MELLEARVREERGARLNTSIGYVRRLLTAFESPRASTGPPRLRVPGTGQPPGKPFTAREREVLRLIAEGFSNGEIAARLFIAPSTVKSYVNRIFRKLDVESRTRAVVEAHRLHLLSD